MSKWWAWSCFFDIFLKQESESNYVGMEHRQILEIFVFLDAKQEKPYQKHIWNNQPVSAIILRNSMPLMDSDTCPAEEPMVVSGFDIPTNSLEPNSQWLNRVKSCEIKSNHVKSTCLTPQISTQFSASSTKRCTFSAIFSPSRLTTSTTIDPSSTFGAGYAMAFFRGASAQTIARSRGKKPAAKRGSNGMIGR